MTVSKVFGCASLCLGDRRHDNVSLTAPLTSTSVIVSTQTPSNSSSFSFRLGGHPPGHPPRVEGGSALDRTNTSGQMLSSPTQSWNAAARKSLTQAVVSNCTRRHIARHWLRHWTRSPLPTCWSVEGFIDLQPGHAWRPRIIASYTDCHCW